MQFRILGRLEVRADDGKLVPLSQPLIRAAICVLLLKIDRPMPSATVGELLWGPADSDRAGSVKTCIGGVRRVLTTRRLPFGHGGYRLRLAEHDTVDLFSFHDLVCQARESAGRGDPALAAELYDRALSFWGDPPLEDLPATVAMSGVTEGLLAERRLAREELVEVRLALGRHRDLIPPLRSWVAAEPLNEHMWGRLMLALYRCGRRAEALQLYDEAHDALVQATGGEPGSELQRMWHRIKVGDPSLAHPAPSGGPAGTSTAPVREPAPDEEGDEPAAAGEAGSPHAEPLRPLARQLPPDVRDFTGRETEQRRLRTLLASARGTPAPAMAQIIGAPGVGKTSLAVHVAHGMAGSFPDGQLYLQLAGASAAPRDPAVVLNEVLRAIGVSPTDIPDTLAERSALYRSRLAGTKVLVVADDAAGPEQIQPLLPGTSGCAMLITSRKHSLNLDGAHLIDLEPLAHPEALRMLGRIIGRERMLTEQDAADRLVTACDGFPLALRIAGARLAARPAWPLAHLAGLLLDDGRRLDQLVAGSAAVRAHIRDGYQALDQRSRRAFRTLALAGPHTVACWVAAILVGEPESTDIVEGLVDTCLLTSVGVDQAGQPRYRLHDLLRDYAAERLAETHEGERALERLTIAWLELADHADALTPRDPYFPPPARITPRAVVTDALAARLVEPDPAAWLASELANLRAAVESACAAGRFRLATGLVLRLAAYLHLNQRHDDAEHLWTTIVAAAEREGDARIAAYARFRAATVICADRGRPAQALPLIEQCVAAFTTLGARKELAYALGLHAYTALLLRRPAGARPIAERGLEMARDCGNRHAEVFCLRVLGLTLSRLDEHERAVGVAEEAVATARSLGHPSYESIALYSLARVRLAAGDHESVPALCEEGLRLTERIGHMVGSAFFHQQWGYAHRRLGRHEEAVDRLERAAALFTSRETLAPGADCRMRLADSHRRLGRYAEAVVHLEWCLAAFAELGRPEKEKRALTMLDACARAAADREARPSAADGPPRPS